MCAHFIAISLTGLYKHTPELGAWCCAFWLLASYAEVIKKITKKFSKKTNIQICKFFGEKNELQNRV